MRLKSFSLAAFILGATVAAAGAQDLPKREFKVLGTWSNLSTFQKIEQPFWTEDLPKASNGRISGQIKSQSELGLKGQELMRMLRLGVFEFAHALPIYIAEDAVVEGVDIAGVAKDFATARKVTEVYAAQMDEVMSKKYGAKLLNYYPFPAQVIYCNAPIKSVADLKGKKVRVQGTSQGDIVEALGGIAVTIAFAEVVPALQRGTVECGITGTMPGFKAGWHEVVTHVINMPVGFTVSFTAVSLAVWNKLDDKTKAFLTAEAKKMEDKGWKISEGENSAGLACTTGKGTCPESGKPGKLVLVEPTKEDIALREKAMQDVVLKRWAKRCGAECVAKWNETVGKLVGLTASGS
ncbi:MAG TPA: TRAP transporter substrate-binding protein [Hyphomicrobiaceae bacterium]|nr:TRAP transporter substrate-binding protein [Hyphomicrobiaceae bacterium]